MVPVPCLCPIICLYSLMGWYFYLDQWLLGYGLWIHRRLSSLPSCLLLHRYILQILSSIPGALLQSPSSSSSYPLPAPLIPSSLAAPLTRRAWSSDGEHQEFLYLTMVVCIDTSVVDPNPAQILRLPQSSVDMAHVTNSTWFDRRWRIIYPIPTGKNMGFLYRAIRRHAVIFRMDT